MDPTGLGANFEETFQTEEPQQFQEEENFFWNEKFVLEEYMNLLRGFDDDGVRLRTEGTRNIGPNLTELEKEASTMI